MISFTKLGNYGRLGNQLFQYAFLRTQAKRLSTQFFCPEWIGDKIFYLSDEKERTNECNTNFVYNEKGDGFHVDVNTIKNGTEIAGFFQSDKYFSNKDVQHWFLFREEICSNIDKKYNTVDFSNSTAIHIRLGDYAIPQLTFYTPRSFYFKNALKLLDHKNTILVFSDDPKGAKEYFKETPGNFIFIEGNKDYEDLYLMSKCRNVICSPSSFSWWAAYLDKYEDKKIIVPEYWFLPWGKAVNNDIFVNGWIKVRAHSWYDYYHIKFIPNKINICYRRIIKIFYILKEGGLKSFFKELKKFFSSI